MVKGYAGKILRVNLTTGEMWTEEPPDSFYRRYLGGQGFVAYYLLKEVPKGADPLGPENVLIFATGTVTGIPVAGAGRSCVGGKSPLTGGYGETDVGGFFGAELKRAGYDAVVIQGKAPKPVYLWIHDGQAEIRSAEHLWGKTTLETQEAIQSELGDTRVRLAMIGPGGEKLVRMACVINDLRHAAGRTGMGAVMGSKNLKAIAVRGHGRPQIFDQEKVLALARWGRENLEDSGVYGLQLNGTANGVMDLQEMGALPTRNWSSGVFEGWQKIWGQTMTDTILKERDTCFGCIVRCKRVVEAKEPYPVDPYYGGPEYETVASLGSYCGVDDLVAIAKANELCNKYGLDTISCGGTIAFAMDCYEQGILTKKDTDGLELRFGNAQAMVQLVQMIAERRGLGDLLAEGSLRAAQKIGHGAEALAVHCKGQEYPAHVPQAKRSLALIYAVNPFGADHMSSEHDPSYEPTAAPYKLLRLSELGLLTPLPKRDLSLEKVRFALTTEYFYSLLDSIGTCQFVWGPGWQLYGPDQLVEVVRAITGWQTSLYELMQVGARRLNLMRAFNAREGFTRAQDILPQKGFLALKGGATDGVAVTEEEFLAAREQYYRLAGWDADGIPTPAKLGELGLDWVIPLLPQRA